MKFSTGAIIGLVIGIPAAIVLFVVLLLTVLGGPVKTDSGANLTATIETQTKTALNREQAATGSALATSIMLVPQPGAPNQWTGYVETASGARTVITVIYDPETQKLLYRTGD